MANENRQQIKNIFNAVWRQKPEERLPFLERVCEDDETRREVESLLASFDDSESFLESPAIGEVTDIIESNGKKLEKGQCFAHYEIVKQIGAGGMGEVYLALDKKLDRKVAIKILNEKFNRHESNLERFVREAKSASGLNHPNILVIHEIGESEDANYIVSEFVEGKTLREIISESPMKLSEVLDIAAQIANALTDAHKAGIVHRDIKPENIMVRPDGFVKILDFGLAKLVEQKNKSLIGLEDKTAKQNQTAKGIILGTVNYMSPEQAKGERVDERTDIFSLGVVIYEMIAGRTPFAGDSMSETFANLINAEPQPLSRFAAKVPDELQHIVSKTLRKNAGERYQTAKDLLLDLKDAKQKLESQNKLRTTTLPHPEESKTQTINETTTKDALHTTSSAEYLLGEIKSHKLGFAGGLIILFLASIGLGYLFFTGRSSFAAPIESIAVLPFENASGDANLDYLSDGLSESLIDRLSGLPQLKVVARNSSFKYRGQTIDLQDAASKLGVEAIVLGKIAQRGDDLTIRVELIDARDNKHLWGEQFNRKAADAFAVQREIAQTVSEKLRLKLSGAQERQYAKQDTVNPQAYELLLRGRFIARQVGTENQKKAIEYYEQAIAVDPNYAAAYAKLSIGYGALAANSVGDPKEFIPKARAAARKALELDENLAESHLAQARLYQTDWDWSAAEAEYKRAIELNPNLSDAHLRYSDYLSNTGRHEQAIEEAKRGRELDPLSLSANVRIGWALFLARRYDEAIVETKKAFELNQKPIPAHQFGYVYAAKGMHREAVAAYRESIRLGDISPSMQIYLGAAYAGAGEREKAQVILKQLETSKGYVSPGELAILYGALGEREQAFASLEKAYAAHDLQLQFLKVDPAFDSLRDDSRFQDLIRRVGLTH